MSYKFRVVHRNRLDDATSLSASDAAITLPVTNLQRQDRRVFRSAQVASATVITATWTYGVTVKAVILHRHNLTTSSTWRVQLYSDTDCTTQIYDSGTVSAVSVVPWGQFIWGVDEWGGSIFQGWDHAYSEMYLAAQYVAKGMKVTISDPTNTAGYIQAARLIVGPYYDMTYGANFGATWAKQTATKKWRSEDGAQRNDNPKSWRTFNCRLEFMTENDRSVIADICERNGDQNDLWISQVYGANSRINRDYAMLAKLVSIPSIDWVVATGWNTQLQLAEA